MKNTKNGQPPSFTKPLLKDLIDRQKSENKHVMQEAQIGSKPLEPAALYQDDGSGYNSDFVFPQA